ncbi:MAG: hypothetical protein AAB581_00965 [Patescibacteria group bacterium]
MSKYILIAGLVLLVLAGVYFAFPGDDADAFVVRSGDGTVELRIPKDAVLEGGTLADITMTAIASSDSARMYRLEPDGLIFSKPVTASITLPYDKNKAYTPAFLTFSGEERKTEILDIKDFQLDEARGTFTVSGALSHFSDLLFTDRYIFDAQYFPKNNITATVGQSFDITHVVTPGKFEQLSKIVKDLDTGEARYQVTTRDRENEYRPEERNYTIVATEVRNGTQWKLKGDGSNTLNTYGVVEPNRVVLAAELGATQEYRVTTRFTCVKSGRDTIIFRAKPIYDPEPTITHVKGGTPGEPMVTYGGGTRAGLVELQGPEISCVAPPAGTTSSGADAAQSGETSAAATPPLAVPKSSGSIFKVCGLPGGEPCPKR